MQENALQCGGMPRARGNGMTWTAMLGRATGSNPSQQIEAYVDQVFEDVLLGRVGVTVFQRRHNLPVFVLITGASLRRYAFFLEQAPFPTVANFGQHLEDTHEKAIVRRQRQVFMQGAVPELEF